MDNCEKHHNLPCVSIRQLVQFCITSLNTITYRPIYFTSMLMNVLNCFQVANELIRHHFTWNHWVKAVHDTSSQIHNLAQASWDFHSFHQLNSFLSLHSYWIGWQLWLPTFLTYKSNEHLHHKHKQVKFRLELKRTDGVQFMHCIWNFTSLYL